MNSSADLRHYDVDGYSGPMVLITLFGEDSYAAPVGDPPPNGGIAWVLRTRERK